MTREVAAFFVSGLARDAATDLADTPHRGQARSYSGAFLPYTTPIDTRQRPSDKRKNNILPNILGAAA
jgi:hypothetical protein